MASSNPPIIEEDPCNSETDEETVALRKKRSRRVSFADREITSVHIFNRDEDYETPPNSNSNSSSKNPSSDAHNEVLGFFKDLADSDDSKDLSPTAEEDDDDEIGDVRTSFLRPVESPSPGSSIVGSATSNDEDNFFGPVSASFIRPGRLSNSSATSEDDNHDITMDSTAFSMHYRSLVRSESGEQKTPTMVRIVFEEKTPLHTSGPGSFMALTETKKLVSSYPLQVKKLSGGRDSNDMSLVGENLRNYDYGTLSPQLEALLAEGSKESHDASVFDSVNLDSLKRSDVSMFDSNGSGYINEKGPGDKSVGEAAVTFMGLNKANHISLTSSDQIYHESLSNNNDHLTAQGSADCLIQTPNQPSKVYTPTQSSKVNDGHIIRKSTVDTGFPVVDHGTPLNMNSKAVQLDFSIQHEFGHLSTEASVKEISPRDSRKDNELDCNSIQLNISPLAGSISSISAKRQEIFLDADKFSRQLSYVTPSPKQPGSFLGNEKLKSSDGGLLKKSNSRLKIFEPSPLARALSDGIEKSKLRLSKFLSSATSLSNTILEEKDQDTRAKLVDAPILDLEKNAFSVEMKNMHHRGTTYMDSGGLRTPENISSLKTNDETMDPAEDVTSLIHVSSHVHSAERTPQLITEMVSPNLFSSSQDKIRQHILKLGEFADETLIARGSDFMLDKIKLNYIDDVKGTNATNKCVSPSDKRLDLESSSSIEYQGSLPGDPKHMVQDNNVANIGSGQDNGHPSAITDKPESSFIKRRAQSSSTYFDINHSEDFTQLKSVADIPDLQHMAGSLMFQTPLKDRNALNFPSGSPNRRDLNFPLIRKEITMSPFSKEPCDAANDENMRSLVVNKMPSPNSHPNGHDNVASHLGLHDPKQEFPEGEIENTSACKRRIEESVHADVDHADAVHLIKRRLNVDNSQDSDVGFNLEHYTRSDTGREMARGDTTMKHWNDISLKLSADTNHLLPPSVDKLNITAMDTLQDILIYLQKIHGTSSSEIHSQRNCDGSNKAIHNRLAETRLLLYKLVYEKAKCQLMSVRHEKLLKRAKKVSSVIQVSQMLKTNYISVNDKHQNLCIANFDDKDEVFSKKVATMRHEFEAVDRKVKNLIKSFHNYLKLKEDPSCAETVILLNEHLKMRTSCRFIREDLQLLEVDDLESSKGQHNIILNYLGFICQRLTINADPIPSILISNELNDINIVKNFPNMDACLAFAYVLNSAATKKYVGSKSLAQETQITSSLLHNLLDVIEEVQQAQIEIRNLVQTKFHCPSAEQLDLQLCFVDFHSGMKVAMTLDMTCLKRGIYPSEVLPTQFQASLTGRHKTLPESLSVKLKDVGDSLRGGYPWIIRLCRCISLVVQSSYT